MVGGAWPFLVGGVICLPNRDNERDPYLLNSRSGLGRDPGLRLLRGTGGSKLQEARGNNRSVMPLDVLGRTRATLMKSTSHIHRNSPWPEGPGNLVKLHRAGDRALQLLLFNEESLVVVIHHVATITSLPFVHTARRYYRSNGQVRPPDRLRRVGDGPTLSRSWSNLIV